MHNPILYKYSKYIYWYTNSAIKSNWNLSIQLYILSIFLKRYGQIPSGGNTGACVCDLSGDDEAAVAVTRLPHISELRTFIS